MVATRQPVTVRLTPAQALRMERMGQTLWPGEKLSAAEVTRPLALTQLLWSEDKHNMVERFCPVETSHKPSRRADPEPHQWPSAARLSES
jgi:hypothetical protein